MYSLMYCCTVLNGKHLLYWKHSKTKQKNNVIYDERERERERERESFTKKNNHMHT